MNITKNHDGSLTLTELVTDGKACGAYYHSEQFFGYTRREAMRIFRENMRKYGKRPERD